MDSATWNEFQAFKITLKWYVEYWEFLKQNILNILAKRLTGKPIIITEFDV